MLPAIVARKGGRVMRIEKRLDVSNRSFAYRRIPTAHQSASRSSGVALLFTEPAMPIGAPLMEVTGCRYPLTADPPYLFCDAPKEIEKSYCSLHHSICHSKSPNVEPFLESEPRSNVVRKPKPKPNSKAAANLELARAALRQRPMSGPFGANSLRGIAYQILLDNPVTVDALMDETGWTLKVARETLSDLSYAPNRKGRYEVHRDRKAGLVWITLPSIDVQVLIG
jgi:hypothetical protein